MNPRTKLLIWILLLAAGLGRAQNPNGVAHLALNSNSVFRVAVALDRVTTVSFPVPITGLEGAFISQEPSVLARFQLSYQTGSRYFSLRALATKVTANLNVILGREIFALELFESRQPAYIVEFTRPPPTKPAPVAAEPPPATISKPANVVQYAHPMTMYDHGAYWVRIEEVFQTEAPDKLVLKVLIHNKTSSMLPFVSAKSWVRVNGRDFLIGAYAGEAFISPETERPMTLNLPIWSAGNRPNLTVHDSFDLFLFCNSITDGSYTNSSLMFHFDVQPMNLAPQSSLVPVSSYQPAYPAYAKPVRHTSHIPFP